MVRRALRMPDFRDYPIPVDKLGTTRHMNTKPVGSLLRDIMARNMDNFRVFGPDENTSNKLDAIENGIDKPEVDDWTWPD
jgi:xylulose-5-phosphate/fructose-6-phosphate phosphoketolase